ncbi:MAG: FeoA family protein [Candidatus Geothermincolia bacterium]
MRRTRKIGRAKRKASGEACEQVPVQMCTMRLGDVAPGRTGTIDKLECSRLLRRRLMDMGIVSGTTFKVERVAPLGDPMELKLNGFNLSLRKKEAGNIWVEVPCD